MYDFSKRYLVLKTHDNTVFFAINLPISYTHWLSFEPIWEVLLEVSDAMMECVGISFRIWKLIAVHEIHVTPFLCVLNFAFVLCWRVSNSFFFGKWLHKYGVWCVYLCGSIISVGGKLRWPLMGVHQSLAGQVGSDPVDPSLLFSFFLFLETPKTTSMGMVNI